MTKLRLASGMSVKARLGTIARLVHPEHDTAVSASTYSRRAESQRGILNVTWFPSATTFEFCRCRSASDLALNNGVDRKKFSISFCKKFRRDHHAALYDTEP